MYSQKLKTGKYRFFESYVDPRTRVRKTTSVTMDKDTQVSRKKAQTLLAARIDKLIDKRAIASQMTFDELVEAYKSSQADFIRPQSLRRNVSSLNKLSELLPDGIKADMVDSLVITDAIKDYSNTKKNGYLKRVRILYRWAYKNGLIDDIAWVSRLQNYPDNAKQRRELKYLERDELEKIVAAADDKYKDAILAMALSGLRVGELCALTKDDITDVISVTKTYSPNFGIGDTKTDGSTREVYIQRELAPILSGERLENVLRVSYTDFSKYFKTLTADVLGRDLTTHALRHTCVSLMAAAGVPLDIISRRLGHADSRVTRDIYMHVTKELKDRDKAVLDSLKLI